jgi:multicomponent Na+:H+ antiporter subunit D
MILFSFFAIPAYMATAFVIVLVSLKKDEYVPFVAVTGALMALCFSILSVPQVLTASPITMQMGEWVAPYGITIHGDALSAILSVIISLVGILSLLFSYRFINERRTKYYSLLSLLFAGALGVVHTGDVFNLFVFIELLSIASYSLISFYRNRSSLEASIKYLIMGSIGTSFLLIGIALLYGLTGTLNMADMASRLPSGPTVSIAFGMILAGLGIKAGFIPFHTLHVDGYSAAPSTVSAVLSTVVANVGIYAILRITFVVFSRPYAALHVLLWLGLFSMLLGAVMALRQDNLKRLLAYSGVSQVGFIIMSIGLGTLTGLIGGLLHMINQIIIESLLFLCIGVVVYLSGTSKLSELSGKLGKDRLLSFSFLAGVLALAGVPMFNGFTSKWIIYVATLEVNPILTVFAVMASVITLAYGIKAYSVLFSGNPEKSARIVIPRSMSIPMVVLVALIILIGVLPLIDIDVATMMASGLDSVLYIQGVSV